ncbi:MAG: hypothetical protein K2J84_00100 [Bacteroidaceae bacterium]|nr:hypothetical protein [Bacteroidaceae bacterium]
MPWLGSVLLWKYCNPATEVLRYFNGSTGVLQRAVLTQDGCACGEVLTAPLPLATMFFYGTKKAALFTKSCFP